MIDINELRKLAQAALVAPDGLSAEWMDRLGQFQESVSPAAITELLDRLEAAEKSDAESIAMYRKARDERDALRAKLEVAKLDLRLIAKTDPVDAALDPQRAIRIAQYALKEMES